jgi:hypothetical protein
MSDNASDDAANPTTDDKARFRAALERKRARHHAQNQDVHGSSKVNSEHTAAGGKRQFRRKSGG